MSAIYLSRALPIAVTVSLVLSPDSYLRTAPDIAPYASSDGE